MSEPILVRPGDDALVDDGDRLVRMLADHDELAATDSRLAPGDPGPPPHVHGEHVDAFYVLEGELEFRLGAALEPRRAGAGTVVAVPPNLVHTFRVGPAGCRFVNLHAPGCGFIDYLRQIVAPPPGRSSAEVAAEIGPRYDLRPPPGDGGRPVADASVVGRDGAERLVTEHRTALVLAELPQLCVLEYEVDGTYEGPDPHDHDDHLDSFFVLDGELVLVLGEEVVRGGTGAFAAAPPGTWHGFTNPGPGSARFLNVHAPEVGFVDAMRRASASTRVNVLDA